ncbi:hypothetical protein HDU86_004263 [Geranomyces michiganensis]|nr:hypothetical protein HDU86_004263 [Geranomyces michiganensis]
MTLSAPVAVTGASGQLGGLVAQALSKAGLSLRLLVRKLDRAPQLPNSQPVQSAYGDGAISTRALQGVQTVFMVSGAESPQRVADHINFIDAAKAAGVRHVVYTSFASAAPDATFTLARDHYHTEQHIIASGLKYTFLRNNLYLDMLPGFVGQDGVIRGPAGDGRLAPILRDDIARAAVAVLLDPSKHVGATYELTGPQAWTLHEIAAGLSAALGKKVEYHNETLQEARASRRAWNPAEWELEAWVSTYSAVASGEMGVVSDDFEKVTGTKPTSLDEFLARLRQSAGGAANNITV